MSNRRQTWRSLWEKRMMEMRATVMTPTAVYFNCDGDGNWGNDDDGGGDGDDVGGGDWGTSWKSD